MSRSDVAGFSYVAWSGPSAAQAPLVFEFAYADGEALQTGRANSRGQLFSLSEGAASSPLLPNLPDIASTPEDPNLQRSGFGPTAHAATARSGTLRMIDLEADASTGRFPAAFETFLTDLRTTAERGRTAQPRGAYLQIRPIPAGTRPPQGAPTINIEALSSISAQAIRTLIERPYYFHRLTDSLPDDVSVDLRQTSNGAPVFITADNAFFYSVLYRLE
ncbi:MAG: hypothetical protein AAFZ02_02115 [Pseudomonadota bacterium]